MDITDTDAEVQRGKVTCPRSSQLVKGVKRKSRLLLDEHRREICRGQGTQLPGGIVEVVGPSTFSSQTPNYLQVRSKHKGLARLSLSVKALSHTEGQQCGPWHGRVGRKESRGANNL